MAIGDNEEEIPRIAAVPPTTKDSVRSSNSSLTVVNRQERGEREAGGGLDDSRYVCISVV